MDTQDTEEAPTIQHFLSLRDCPGPVTKLITSDFNGVAQEGWWGPFLKGRGHRYSALGARPYQALACATFADNPAFYVAPPTGRRPARLRAEVWLSSVSICLPSCTLASIRCGASSAVQFSFGLAPSRPPLGECLIL
jgi:hypothetical protein